MKISISPFAGELPKLNAKMLPEINAQETRGCDFDGMSLKPAKGNQLLSGFESNVRSLYRSGRSITYRWHREGVNMVESPLNDDQWDRLYWTGDGSPKMATSTMANTGTPPGASLTLGIPAPTTSLSVEQPSTEEPEDGGYEINVIYTVTFISAYGEEGPPALASNMITKWSGQSVTLNNIPMPPTGGHNIVTKRIYRSESSGSFLFVADIPASSSNFTDSVPTESLGEPMPSLDWDMPDSRMIGLTSLGNGMLAGWFDNTLCFCEPYYPHAWPVGYQLGFDSEIVGIAPVTGGVIVVTKREPWLVSGATPAAMSQTKLDFTLGCVSRYSVVDMGEYAIYASAEGLIAVGGRTPSLMTDAIISRQQWQAYNPETIKAFRWREKYLAFYEQDGVIKAFILDQDQGLVNVDVPEDARCMFLDPATSELIIATNSGSMLSFESGVTGSFYWKSKIFTAPQLAGMSVLKIDADGYPITATVYADGFELITLDIESSNAVRLPAGRYRNWEIALSGASEIYSVQMASSPSELL